MSRARLVHAPISVDEVVEAVADDAYGAGAFFLGRVRESNAGRPVTGIEYTAYDAMAARELERIIDEASARFAVDAVAVTHRLGMLAVGEVSVAVAVGHAHRAPALDCLRFVIEELKRRVPIWKRELYVDGTREWVDPTR